MISLAFKIVPKLLSMTYKAPCDQAPPYLGHCSPTPNPQTYSNIQPHCFALEPPKCRATKLVLALRPLPHADQMTPNTLHQIFAPLAPHHSRSMKCCLLRPSLSTVSKITDLTLHPCVFIAPYHYLKLSCLFTGSFY